MNKTMLIERAETYDDFEEHGSKLQGKTN